MRIEALHPLHIRRAAGDLHLRPGVPVELPDEEAAKLLQKVPNKVRVVAEEEIVIEPATKPSGEPLSPIFWERTDGSIVGPAQPEFFAKVGTGNTDKDFWIIVLMLGHPAWVRADRLRSKRDYNRQALPKIVEKVKEPK